MRIAVLIISLCLTMLVGLQSCTVMIGGGLTDDQDLAGGGGLGILIAFLFVLGGAFALSLPKVSMVMFAIAAFFGAVAASNSAYSDMWAWTLVSLALAVMSYFGSRELRRKKAAVPQ